MSSAKAGMISCVDCSQLCSQALIVMSESREHILISVNVNSQRVVCGHQEQDEPKCLSYGHSQRSEMFIE